MECDAGSASLLEGKTSWSNGVPGGLVWVAEASSIFGAGVSPILVAGSAQQLTFPL